MTPPTDRFSLAGKTALITGAGGGLGLAMAKAMCAAGAHVLLNGRRADVLDSACAALRQAGGRADAVVFDVADLDAGAAALDVVWEKHGHIDILVNNVGVRDRSGIWKIEPETARTMMETNFDAPFFLSRRVAARLIEKNFPGRIINISSLSGLVSGATDPIYASAKGALLTLTRTLASALGRNNITVNAIVPGVFRTEPNLAILSDPKIVEAIARRTPLGRPGEPEEIAGAAVFLASESSAYMTGQVLVIDGGRSIQS